VLTELALAHFLGGKGMRGIPVWLLIGGGILVLLVVVPLVTGQPLLSISGGGISLNLPGFKLASGNIAPAQSTSGVLV
jgi:hypothetical protein